MRAIGIGVLVAVYNPQLGKFLFGRRKGGTGDGQWCLPGGRLEPGELLENGVRREVGEETGITDLEELVFVCLVNDVRIEEGEHFIHIIYQAMSTSLPRLMEPDQFTEWDWFSQDQLPEPIFYRHQKAMEAWKYKKLVSG